MDRGTASASGMNGWRPASTTRGPLYGSPNPTSTGGGGLSPSSMADYHDEFLRAQGAGSAALYAMIGESIGEALTNVMADRAIDSINRLDG